VPTLTTKISEWACGVTYEDLTPEAIDAAKRFLFDTLACALGGRRFTTRRSSLTTTAPSVRAARAPLSAVVTR
jgi:2-methylcitrate dehydratase PrpD